MELDWNVLKPQERLSLQLRLLYEQEGFRKYHMSRFEEYGLYQENRRFLPAEQVITFTDLDGRLLALKPDVTLSIAKNAPADGTCSRYYYSENVYRPSQESHTFREISQMGVECIGAVDEAVMAQTVSLALKSLEQTGRTFVLELSHMGFASGLFDAVGAPEGIRPRLLACIRDRNRHELAKAASLAGLSKQGIDALCMLPSLKGPWEETLAAAEPMALNAAMGAALDELRGLCRKLAAQGQGEKLRLDLSLVNDMDYYNGLVLQGYLAGIPRAVLKGGRYDPLAAQFRSDAKAIGFALYLDELERLSDGAESCSPAPGMLSVALPKGRLGDKVYKLLSGAGYGCVESYSETRKLVVENVAAGIRYFLVKPSDVAIYVERGAADIGIVGKDILEEAGADVYELLDTGLGKCRMCVAGPEDFEDDPGRALRVATKFVSIAKAYYAARGRDIDVIKLGGSIELAPILGLSDVIVDIVETGVTLRENHLKVLTEFMPISARLIANRASYQFKREQIDTLAEKLREVTEQ